MGFEAVIENYKSFFEKYFKSFKGLSPGQENNFHIKKEHSYRVAGLCKTLGTKLGMSDDELAIAYIIGLFHDIGRFPQLVKYNTFDDTVSADHAELSLEVLNREKILDELDSDVAQIVGSAILYHNKESVPLKLGYDEIRYARLVRDADKLDILSVLVPYYEQRNATPNHTLTWELPSGFTISPAVIEAAKSGNTVPREAVANQLDIKIFQMSWVYDLNFRPSFLLLSESRLLERIYKTLPPKDDVINIYRAMKVYMENQFLK